MTESIDPRADLLQYLQTEATRANDTTLQDARATAIEYYKGEPFGDEVEGRSQLRTRDVAEVVDQQVINVLRTMVSGDHVVEFDGEGDDGTDYGMEATEAVQYQFMRKQNGYRVLHDSLKAGLLEKTGIVKSWPERKWKIETAEVPAELLGELEVIAAEEIPQIDETGNVIADEFNEPVTLWRVKHRVQLPTQFRDMAVPNEEFEIAPDARTLDGPEYKAHICEKTLSELLEMGFPIEDVNTIWGGNTTSATLSDARNVTPSQSGDPGALRPGMQRKVWLREEYVAYDADGDGYSELLQIFRVDNTILSIEEVDENPFSGWCPYPMQHRFIGDSSADKAMDIQVTRSAMLRQAMDNLYLSNRPRMAVNEAYSTEDTLSDTLSVVIGGVIRHRGEAPTPVAVPFVAGHAFEAMEVMLGEREQRTGVTRHNQGLNPDTLNKTASGMAMLQASGDQVQEYIARNFAEDLVAPMFAKRYRLMRKFGQPFSMKIDGKRVEIDPRKWPAEPDMLINVGLGTGRKDQRLMYRTQLLEVQKEALTAGSDLVTEENIYNNVRGMIKDAALGSPSDYITDPKSLVDPETGEKPEKPDPQERQQQIDAMLEAQKLQGEQAEQERQANIKAMQTQADIERANMKAQNEMDIQADRAAAEAALAVRRQNFDEALARERFEFEKEMQRQKATAMTAAEEDELPKYRPGGDLAK